MVKVTVTPSTVKNIVVVKKTGSVISTEKVTVKNVPAVPSGSATKLDSLSDVDTSIEEDGSVLIYDADTDKYVVKPLELDGGEF
jgi:hypothetical protein